MTTLTPEVFWAQRSSADEPAKNVIYLTIVAPDLKTEDLKVELKDQSLSFKGTSTSKKVTYAVDLEFYAEIDTENCKWFNNGRGVEFLLRKKEHKQEYWPRLLKESKRMHFLKTDFDKWVDEDEQDEVADDLDTSAMNPMGGGDGGFGGIDFSKLGAGGMGGMGGMPGMEGMDMSQMMANMGGGAPGGDDSDDDDDMPELENDEDNKEKAPAAAASGDKPKIEEVA